MSPEDETFDNDVKSWFKVNPLPFSTRKYNILMDLANKKYLETCSKQSKEQFKVQIQGLPSKRYPSKCLEYGYDISITET